MDQACSLSLLTLEEVAILGDLDTLEIMNRREWTDVVVRSFGVWIGHEAWANLGGTVVAYDVESIRCDFNSKDRTLPIDPIRVVLNLVDHFRAYHNDVRLHGERHRLTEAADKPVVEVANVFSSP